MFSKKLSNPYPVLSFCAKLVLKETNWRDLIFKWFVSLQIADGLVLEKTSCPLGVLLIVFESRPDALVQVIIILFSSLLF